MPLLHIFILALVQGITEFLPISSSGHLVLAHEIIGARSTDLMIDVAVHVGTLGSVLVYFRKDVLIMLAGIKDCILNKCSTEEAQLSKFVMISSLPVIFAGLALHAWQPTWLRGMEIVAWTTLIFGILLWVVDVTRPADREIRDMNLKDALIIGLAQVLALIPGTSRSGITMTAGRFLGYSHTESAHYSLLLAIIAISGAGLLESIALFQTGNMALGLDALLAALIAFASGWVAIALMMNWLKSANFAVFAAYRVILGLVLLGFVYGFLG